MTVRADHDLSPQMRERYGVDRNPWPARLVGLAVAVVFGGLLAYAVFNVLNDRVESRLLLWEQPQPDLVDITFEVRRPNDLTVVCALRAQDADRVDLGYATTSVPAGATVSRHTYPLRVLGPALYVEVLGCAENEPELRVPEPAFPPGVLAPQQPWTAP